MKDCANLAIILNISNSDVLSTEEILSFELVVKTWEKLLEEFVLFSVEVLWSGGLVSESLWIDEHFDESG